MAQLEGGGDAKRVPREYFGYKQTRAVALREPDLSSFSAREIALVTWLLDQFRGKTAHEISELSHDFVGWQVARDGEEIRYEAALISDRPPTAEERAYGASLEDHAKRCLARNT
jgi:hypothetical protein